MDLLEDIMDEQFDTVCEDESIKEVSSVLIKLFDMAKSGNIEAVRSELAQLPPCTVWITQSFQVKRVKEESSSSDEDDEMTVDQGPSNNLMIPSTSGSTMEFEEEDPDPGWTVVKKGKKPK
jgi:pre-rRNA-processing protein TSR2